VHSFGSAQFWAIQAVRDKYFPGEGTFSKDLNEGLRAVTGQGWLSSTSLEFQRAILSGAIAVPLKPGRRFRSAAKIMER
jgi:hypothetical protein